MSRQLEHLVYPMRQAACELIARCAERKVWLIILDTLRTPEEQQEYLRTGRSKTLNSKHLPQKPNGLSHAMDAAPVLHLIPRDADEMALVKAINWNTQAPEWQVYGEIATSLDLVWGGSWEWKDYSHVEIP